MTELKPCPKGCDSFIKVSTGKGLLGGLWVANVRCEDCGIELKRIAPTQKDALHEAIEAWNTRAERTCNIKWNKELFCYVCDACDHISMMAPNSHPNYCPNCGAKVVE